jgi:hypothetical protein
MQKFKCTYSDMMNDPADVILNNISIMGLEGEERNKQEKMAQMKSKMNKRGR